ncbi:hypothetical protein CC80DRAFT_496156 [Byssothecium circinans]|uniref:Uncharacterized protein n=1 Tax=Byssothecium circinans TaxID=147558 RepID=A0A6A5TG66_9PLEO|nr:hypothetical protein CC80DRAFT_496156 [Byssothecium circinans]
MTSSRYLHVFFARHIHIFKPKNNNTEPKLHTTTNLQQHNTPRPPSPPPPSPNPSTAPSGSSP